MERFESINKGSHDADSIVRLVADRVVLNMLLAGLDDLGGGLNRDLGETDGILVAVGASLAECFLCSV